MDSDCQVSPGWYQGYWSEFGVIADHIVEEGLPWGPGSGRNKFYRECHAHGLRPLEDSGTNNEDVRTPPSITAVPAPLRTTAVPVEPASPPSTAWAGSKSAGAPASGSSGSLSVRP